MGINLEEKQKTWGDGIVWIGQSSTPEMAKARATKFIEEEYVLDGTLLFAPTLAREKPFRPNFPGILSYFIGGNPDFPEDSGFALKGWTTVRFENTGVVETPGLTVAMGLYYFTNPAGEETKVEYTFGYRTEGHTLGPIQVHHSALPFSG